ncbi:hypothetical protein [Tessaracoccus sp.]
MSLNHRVVAPFALAALALGMTACAPDAAESTPTVTVTTSADASPSMEPTAATSEPNTEESQPMGSPSEDAAGPNDESGVVDVTVEGDQGILALKHAGSVPVGTAGPTGQKLITGPGGCFAVTNEGKPQLLVFPDDATFVLQEGKPSATIAGTEHPVGRQFAVATTAVAQSSVVGIPDRCLQGSDDTVLVVN